MRCVVTIMQNKRVAMPYYFGRYSYPSLLAKFRGDVKLIHVFHSRHVEPTGLASNKMSIEHIDKVRRAIKGNMYPDAKIFEHTELCSTTPMMPSLKLALQLALKEHADFHLWLEDDAIVYDQQSDTWATTLGSADVGLYQDTDSKQLINTAYFLSTREFDKRFERVLEEFSKDMSIPDTVKGRWDDYANKGSLIEHCAWRAARKPVYLGPDKAYRHHPHQTKSKKTCAMVRTWLEDHIPNISNRDLELLASDFQD